LAVANSMGSQTLEGSIYNSIMSSSHEAGMRLAISQAMKSADEVPVGAAIYDCEGNLLSVAHNTRESTYDPTGHAEILALREASRSLGSWRLEGSSIFISLEPCVMCAGAIRNARVSFVTFGAYNPLGAAGSLYDILRDRRLGSVPEITSGVLEQECERLTHNFFASKRDGARQ
jgi:tRNA(adenine34) deaminase